MIKTVAEVATDKIRKAWKSATYPGDEHVFLPGANEDFTEYFFGTTWEGHSAESLRWHCVSFRWFFTPIAYLYWLPAYLIASVEDPEELDVCLSSLVDSFLPETEEAEFYAEQSARLALLTNEQKLAVIATLEVIIEQLESQSEPAHDENKALKYIRSITNLA